MCCSRGKLLYRVDFAEPLSAGKELVFNVEAAYGNSLTPYPAQIQQSEKQFVRFIGNSNFYSPYKTTRDSTTVTCTTSTIESYTKNKPVSASDNTITYGPYENVAPFTEVRNC